MSSDLYPLQNVKTIRELKTAVSSIYENLESRSGELTPGTKLKKTNLSVGIATALDLQEMSSDLHSEVSSVESEVVAISSDLVDSLSNVVIPKLDIIGNLVSAQSENMEAVKTELSTKADLSSLATVATTGSYNDLLDLPTIPEANDGILTIQRNGTTLTSFSANQSSNITANIAVPTKTSDLSNDSDFVASTALTAYVSKTTTVNGQQLTGNIVLNAASVSAATEAFVLENITQGTAIYRGSYASKAALISIDWQTSDPEASYYVSNNDYAVVQDDESNNDECWRYIYVTENGAGWTAQYMINESPLTNAQLSALNSGATSAIIASVADKADRDELSGYLSTSLSTEFALTSYKINGEALSGDITIKTDEDVYLDYATVTSLSLVQSTDVYKMTLTADGVSAAFPEIDPTSIPNRNAYYRFELEITVPSGVTTMTFPSCYEWLNEDDIPEPGLVEGKTIYIAARFDCSWNRSNLAGSTLINIWRIK